MSGGDVIVVQRGSDAPLRLALAHALAEEIRIAAEVLGRRRRDRVDAVLDRDMAGGREPGDPVREGADDGQLRAVVAELARRTSVSP